MVKIKVDNKFLDLQGTEIFALKIPGVLIGDLGNRRGEYSVSFEIPDSAKNRSILGLPDANVQTTFPYRKNDATLLNDSTVYRKGFLRVERIVRSNKTIECSFFTGIAEWTNRLSDRDWETK